MVKFVLFYLNLFNFWGHRKARDPNLKAMATQVWVAIHSLKTSATSLLTVDSKLNITTYIIMSTPCNLSLFCHKLHNPHTTILDIPFPIIPGLDNTPPVGRWHTQFFVIKPTHICLQNSGNVPTCHKIGIMWTIIIHKLVCMLLPGICLKIYDDIFMDITPDFTVR